MFGLRMVFNLFARLAILKSKEPLGLGEKQRLCSRGKLVVTEFDSLAFGWANVMTISCQRSVQNAMVVNPCVMFCDALACAPAVHYADFM